MTHSRAKFMDLNTYVRREQRYQKQKQIKSKISRRKETIKDIMEMNEIKYIKTIEKMNRNQNCFFKRSVDTLLHKLTKKIREKAQMTKLGMKEGISLLTFQILKGYKGML